MTDLPELPGWMLAYAPLLLNVAFWVILVLGAVIGLLGGVILTFLRWWIKSFTARMSAQDATLEEIKELVSQEISELARSVMDNSTRIVRLEEWRKMVDDHFKHGRRKDDSV